MDRELQNIIRSNFKELPEKVQQLILSPQLAQNLKDMSERYRLSPEQAETFETEVMVVLFSFDSLENFSTNLQKHSGIESNTVSQLVNITRQMLFNPIQSDLEQMANTEEHGIVEEVNKEQIDARHDTAQKKEHFVRGGWHPEHVPDAKSAERPISSSLIRKRVENRKSAEQEHEEAHPQAQRPKPYWPDPYRESLDSE